MTDVIDTTGAPAVPAAAQELDRRRVLLVIGALMLGMLLAALDQTVVSTALPTIVGDLHDSAHIAWIVTAYLLLSTVSTPLWGKLGDLYGRKAFFQAAIVIFLVGSVLSGLSQTMAMLIGFRALQGLGAGGLMVGAQAIVGDVVSPRDRGRYQGLFGAVFAVATVIGPLIGGFLTQDVSWRWVFYINLPVGAVALAVTAAVLPSHLRRVQHVIDYLGTVLLTGGATAFVLVASLGGITYAWGSSPILILAVAGVVLVVAWAYVERRVVEPVLPLRLFANRVFAVSSAMGFVVGFALFGAVTFLPVFLQVAKGVDPTISGLQLLPLMGGMLFTSILSGMLISRFGRYKVFPIVGSILMTVGMYLLSTVGATSSSALLDLYMVVVGLGMGGVMQVLVIAAQNAVPYEDLGVATAGATFFRSIGGSFGTAIFGAIFANVLVRHLAAALHRRSLPSGLGEAVTPAKLAHLTPAVHHAVAAAYASTVDVVFLVTVPIVGVAFLLALVLPEVRLRTGVRGDAAATGA
jgi:EmrB/QacA subfamily drug resistance transporter